MAEQQMSEEQVKALQEKLKQMSPEELKEFQKKQCIFCHIIAGKVQARKVYEDEHVLAVLDINPANPGHLLVMPKEHYTIMPQMPDSEIGHTLIVAKALSNACLRALEAKGSNFIIANGVAAGQRAQHFMLHLIPRKEKDGLTFEIPQKNMPEEELQQVQGVLAMSLDAKPQEQKPAPKEQPPQKSPSKEDAPLEDEKEQTMETEQPEDTGPEKTDDDIDLDDVSRILGVK